MKTGAFPKAGTLSEPVHYVPKMMKLMVHPSLFTLSPWSGQCCLICLSLPPRMRVETKIPQFCWIKSKLEGKHCGVHQNHNEIRCRVTQQNSEPRKTERRENVSSRMCGTWVSESTQCCRGVWKNSINSYFFDASRVHRQHDRRKRAKSRWIVYLHLLHESVRRKRTQNVHIGNALYIQYAPKGDVQKFATQKLHIFDPPSPSRIALCPQNAQYSATQDLDSHPGVKRVTFVVDILCVIEEPSRSYAQTKTVTSKMCPINRIQAYMVRFKKNWSQTI